MTGDRRDWGHGLDPESLVRLDRFDAFDETYFVECLDNGTQVWVHQKDLDPPPSDEEIHQAIASIRRTTHE